MKFGIRVCRRSVLSPVPADLPVLGRCPQCGGPLYGDDTVIGCRGARCDWWTAVADDEAERPDALCS